MSSERYRHIQFSRLIVIIVVAINAVGAAIAIASGVLSAAIVFGVTALVLVPLYGWLTVTVDDTHVVVRFGVGLIRKRFALGDVTATQPARLPWYYGTGIHRMRGGWLYKVGGPDAVQLDLAGGSRALVGTDEPERLIAAIQEAAATTPSGNADTTAGPDVRLLLLAGAVFAAVIGAAVYYQSRQMEVAVGDAELTVRSGFYSASVPIAEIREVIVVDSLPRIARSANGFSFGPVRRGHFQLDSIGAATLFVTLGNPPYIIVRSARTMLVIGFRDPAKARRLIEDLSRRAGG